MVQLLLYFWDYSIILPAAFACVMPVINHSKISKKILIPVMSVSVLAGAFLLALWRYFSGASPNSVLGIVVIPSFILYLFAFDAKKTKLIYIFITTIALFSFGGLATYYVDAMFDPVSNAVVSYSVEWGISLTFLVFELVFLKKLTWLMDNKYIDSIWHFVWVVPLIIAAANFMMIPLDYKNVHVGRIFLLYVLVEIMLVVFFLIFLIMQYTIARAITNKVEAEQNAHILSLQAVQYENLRKYMDSTSKLRHDFIFMAKTAQNLASNGEIEELRKLLNDYGASIDANTAPSRYCEHIALNAITAYYENEAKEADIRFNIRLNVPQNIVISDYEICSVIGNILDNAISAAKETDIKDPRILFVADTKPNGDLYIAVSNPYSGTIKRKENVFTSTKKDGHGIGLESVKAIVGKNNGYCNFRYDDNTFYSEILLRQG